MSDEDALTAVGAFSAGASIGDATQTLLQAGLTCRFLVDLVCNLIDA